MEMFCPSPCPAPLPGASQQLDFSSQTRLTCCSDLPYSSPGLGPTDKIPLLFALFHPSGIPSSPRLLAATESLIALQRHPTTPLAGAAMSGCSAGVIHELQYIATRKALSCDVS